MRTEFKEQLIRFGNPFHGTRVANVVPRRPAPTTYFIPSRVRRVQRFIRNHGPAVTPPRHILGLFKELVDGKTKAQLSEILDAS